MKIQLNLLNLMLLFSGTAYCQNGGNLMVTWNYNNQTVGYILKDIAHKYEIKFSYSSNIVEVQKKVSSQVKNVPFKVGFDQFCEIAALKYANIGNQIVLKAGKKQLSTITPKPRRIEKITRIETPNLPRYIKQQTPIYPEPESTTSELLAVQVDPIEAKEIKSLPGGDRVVLVDSKRFQGISQTALNDQDEDYNRLAQISILPRVGTNAKRSEDMTNNVSVNLFWGANGGVDGLEVGGIFNHIKTDVKGIQVAGIGNHVNEDLIGTQASGLFNVTGGKVEGVQASGLFNYAEQASAIQASGLFNISGKSFKGLQVAPIFNYAGPGAGVQISGLTSLNKGSVKTQISGLMNVAGDVDYAQISPLLNVAKKVEGFQFGLINVADTVSGVPFGLLNIVKKGYNHLEFFASEALVANMGLKLGARSFYNIFQVGIRWDDETIMGPNATEINETKVSWGLGYGFGTAITLNSFSLLNIEAIGMHINEGEEWTDDLNLLGQFKILVDMRIGRHTSIFAGPTGNIMFSNRFDPDSNTYGSTIMPYTLYDETEAGVNTKVWIGFSGGIRF